MQIYHQNLHNEICYSIKMVKSVKKNIAYIKKHFIRENVEGIGDLKPNPLFINKDRKQTLYMKIDGSFLQDIYFYHAILTKTNLSLVSNQRSMFLVRNKGYFRTPPGAIPLTHASDYLNSLRNIWTYQGVTVTVYKRLFPIKLGFFGTHLQRLTRAIRTVEYLK